MKIYSMTATFGKLEQAQLTLEPGMNVIHAPNEWGKSTWCAFLMAMFYGIETRAKTTKTVIADKERYAPWSGSPMSGRIDLCWKGRDITIERTTRGRTPMGVFRAYETATGVEVPELTAANCGKLLIGEEQSVYRRCGFLRLSDLPVTRDDAFLRRMQDLVTTADESGDGERLARQLKELKNKLRYNRTGLIPETQRMLETVLGQMEEKAANQAEQQTLQLRRGEAESWLAQLENHKTALEYAKKEQGARRIAEASDLCDHDARLLAQQEAACAALPGEGECQEQIIKLQEFMEQWRQTAEQWNSLPVPPAPMEADPAFQGLTDQQALAQAEEDTRAYTAAGKNGWGLTCGAAVAVLIAAAVLGVLGQYLAAGLFGAVGVLLWIPALKQRQQREKQRQLLLEKYAGIPAEQWMTMAQKYAENWQQNRENWASYRTLRGELDAKLSALGVKKEALCGSQEPEKLLASWQQALEQWSLLAKCREQYAQSQRHLQALQSVAYTAEPPAFPDALNYSPLQTEQLLEDAKRELLRLESRLGQIRGRGDALPGEEILQSRRSELEQRLDRMLRAEKALELSLTALAEARLELQRRFAPQIAARAKEYLGEMTNGRYVSLFWNEDLALHAAAQGETVQTSSLWRSDGTVDQLYIALRLAVAQELIPQAPLVLDDALARCDDTRLAAIMRLLTRLSESRQIILFSCHSREEQLLDGK